MAREREKITCGRDKEIRFIGLCRPSDTFLRNFSVCLCWEIAVVEAKSQDNIVSTFVDCNKLSLSCGLEKRLITLGKDRKLLEIIK